MGDLSIKKGLLQGMRFDFFVFVDREGHESRQKPGGFKFLTTSALPCSAPHECV